MLTPVLTPLLVALLATGFAGTESYLGPSLSLNFSENSYSMGSVGQQPVSYAATALITFTRPTAAWEWDWQGNYSEVAAGVMRIAHDPLTKSTSTTPQTLGTGSYTFAVTYQYPIGKAVRVSADAANWMVGRVTASSPTSVTILVSSPPTGAGTYSAWTLIVRRGIRVEEQRTNLLLSSVLAGGTSGVVGAGAVAPTNWVFGSSGGLIAYGTSPWGAASFLTTKTTTADRPFLQRTFATIANTAYTLSARVVSVSGVNQIADLIEPAGRPAGSSVTYAVNGVVVSGTDMPSLKAWDLISTTVQVGATGGAVLLRLGIGAARPTAPIGSVELTMPQLEVGASPSTYIPTEASQVTRAADVCSVNTLSPWYNAMEGTLVVDGIPLSASGALANVVTLDDGTSNNRIHLRHTSTTSGSGIVLVAGVVQASFTSPANSWPIMASRKAAIAYKENSFAFSVSGGAPLTDSAGLVPAVSRMIIGAAPGYSSASNGIISRITYYPRVIDVQQASA